MCKWINNGDFHETSCGNSFQFTDDGYSLGTFKFWPFCGEIIEADVKETHPKCDSCIHITRCSIFRLAVEVHGYDDIFYCAYHKEKRK